MSSSSASAGRAPGWAKTRTPSRKAISVGIERMPAAAASCCSASVSTLPKTMSGCVSEAASNTGAKARHGPHHAAQKSTRTMPSEVTVSWKEAAVSAVEAMVVPSGAVAWWIPTGV